MLKVISISAVSIALIALISFLLIGEGKPISTDLSVIGQGKPSLVLAYENYSIVGGEALNRLRKVSSDFDSRLNFVVADLGTPPGRDIAQRHKLVDGLAVLFKQNGQAFGILNIPEKEQQLRSLLESKLSSLE